MGRLSGIETRERIIFKGYKIIIRLKIIWQKYIAILHKYI